MICSVLSVNITRWHEILYFEEFALWIRWTNFFYWRRLTFAVNCIFMKVIPWWIFQISRYHYISYWLQIQCISHFIHVTVIIYLQNELSLWIISTHYFCLYIFYFCIYFFLMLIVILFSIFFLSFSFSILSL